MACLAGLLLIAAALITIASVLGRNYWDYSLDGDTELVAALVGAAIAQFLPWCQLTKGNIIVDFFTTLCSPAKQQWLDRVGALLLAAAMAILAWRTVLGAISAWQTGSGSMIMGLPDWIVQSALVPGLVVSALIAATQALSQKQGEQP